MSGTALGLNMLFEINVKKQRLSFLYKNFVGTLNSILVDQQFEWIRWMRIETLKKLANVFKFGRDIDVQKIPLFFCRDCVASKKLSDIAFLVYKECCILRINYVRSFVFNQF